ncbi:MAG TPA: hypothetical protein VNJ01_17540 [Bacteriovoracaceae bacterium]|nr:hypothetical protein [Bacteriovoracaceae bacterium]
MNPLSGTTLPCKRNYLFLMALVLSIAPMLTGCGNDNDNRGDFQERRQQQQVDGQDAFRFETFGNEGFWTDAARLPQGIAKSKLTPVQALKAGLSVNTDALDGATLAAVADELKNKGTRGPILNDPATTIKLINANAVIGVVVRDSNGDGTLDVTNGDKAGVSCVLCHAVTDGAALQVPNGGSIGKQVDGPAVHNIQIGKIFAMADNTRALYPMAQIKGPDGKSTGLAPSAKGLTKTSSEAEFDAYFGNSKYYPVGSFDDTVDGIGNPMHNTPMFRQDLAAPFGSAGELETSEQFANTVFTVLLDPTNLLSPGGRAFLNKAAKASGDKLASDYAEVLAATGVTNYPYIEVSSTGEPGTLDHLIGIAVDNGILQSMASYVEGLRAPPGVVKDAQAVARGREHFVGTEFGCTTCHNADNSQPVPQNVIDMKTIFPGDMPKVLATRDAPAGPVSDTPKNTFDDKMIVINATLRGANRGAALPLLMDLKRKPVFLHDNSVSSLFKLLNPARGSMAPHPFYVKDQGQRWDLVRYLESLDDTTK